MSGRNESQPSTRPTFMSLLRPPYILLSLMTDRQERYCNMVACCMLQYFSHSLEMNEQKIEHKLSEK